MKRLNGFSLIELLVVITIIGTLSAISISVYKHYSLRVTMSQIVASIGILKDRIQLHQTTHGNFPTALSQVNGRYVSEFFGSPNSMSEFDDVSPPGCANSVLHTQLNLWYQTPMLIADNTANGQIDVYFVNTNGTLKFECAPRDFIYDNAPLAPLFPCPYTNYRATPSCG